jgi:hypothetical protein
MGAANFNTLQTNKRILYSLLLSNFNHNNNKLFYFEVISYIINLCNSIVYSKKFLNSFSSKISHDLKERYIDIIYKGSMEREAALLDSDYSISKFLFKEPVTLSPKISNNIQTNF